MARDLFSERESAQLSHTAVVPVVEWETDLNPTGGEDSSQRPTTGGVLLGETFPPHSPFPRAQGRAALPAPPARPLGSPQAG